MKHPRLRRTASALLMVQAIYIVLALVAFATVGTDTAQLDHDPALATGFAEFALIPLLCLVAAAGGAALLGSSRVQRRVPPVVRVSWLALLALGEAAIVVGFLLSVAAETPGVDTVFGAAALIGSGWLAMVCGTEAVRGLRAGRRVAA